MKENKSSPTDQPETKHDQIQTKEIPNVNISPGLAHEQEHDYHDQHLRQYTPAELKKIKIRGVISVIGGVLLHVVLGTFYTWGTISPYIAAYMKQYDSSVTLSFMSIVFPFLGLITNSVLSFGVKLASKIGFKPMIFIFGTSIAAAFLIDSFLTNIYGFIAIYCVMIGVSTGLIYMLPVLCGWKYFPNNRGTISGLTIAGYGFGSFIFNFVCLAIVNPNNQHPDVPYMEDGKKVLYFGKDVYEKVPLMLQVLSGSSFGLVILATFMINYPRELHLEFVEEVQKSVDPKQKADYHQPNDVNECDSISQGLKSKPFALFVPLIWCSCLLGMLLANCYKIYGLSIGIDDAFLTIAGSVASVTNGCARALWATLMDKTSFRFVILLIVTIQMILSACLGYVSNSVGYLILLALSMGCEGGLLSCFPAACQKIFGQKCGPLIYGFLFFQIGVSTMLGYLMYKFLVGPLGYSGVFWICFGANALAFILTYLLDEDHEWTKKSD